MTRVQIRRLGLLLGFVLTIPGFPMPARACIRELVDRRAVQWSDEIVVATLTSIQTPPGHAPELYQFNVVETIDGKMTRSETFDALHRTPPGAAAGCGGRLSSADVGKPFVVLLRKSGTQWLVVTIAPRDTQVPTALDALKQLVSETRKADAGVTDARASLQARTYADAADDTEADQAEKALQEMGPRAAAGIRTVLLATSASGKTRLSKLLTEILPPSWVVDVAAAK